MGLSGIIFQDTRFWEVFDADKKSLGLFMYGDIIQNYTPEYNHNLASARIYMDHIGHSMKLLGDIFPLEEDSIYPIIQEKKDKLKKKEKKRSVKEAFKKGFKLLDKLHFGKHKGSTLKEVIEKDPSYWNWLHTKNIILLHPEMEHYL